MPAEKTKIMLTINLVQPKFSYQQGNITVDGDNINVFQSKFEKNDRNLKSICVSLARPMGGGKKTLQIDWLGEVVTVDFDFSNEKASFSQI